MSRNAYTGPRLPGVLLDKIQDGSGSKSKHKNVSRKEMRKAERQQKKIRPQRKAPVAQSDFSSPEPEPKKPKISAKPLKSILKKESSSAARPVVEPASESSEERVPVIARGTKQRLQEDNAEIAALEKKLGIKGQKSKPLEQDGLDWLAEGSGEANGDDGDDGNDSRALKRKRGQDTKWLRDKRLKATGDAALMNENDSDGNLSESKDIEGRLDGLETPFSEDEVESDDFEGFDGPNIDKPRQKQQRENPFVAPVAKDAAPVAKYVPPSLRKPAASDEETLRQLQRQIQGLLNRLSEANLLSILQSLEELYTKNARQHVSSTLVDLLVGLIADPSILNDTFLILHAGFSAAVYRVIGTDFGAQLLEKMVETFEQAYNHAGAEGKQPLNILAFISNLYTFQVIGSPLIFDYLRILLDELSETNTELLLRIIRTSGQQLRHEDPSALKDVVLLLQRSVAKVGEDKLSVRTKFMIETIHHLKNNRMKAGVAASALVAEHVAKMKKILGSLSSSRTIKATEPLRINLSDIRNGEKKGKWWLVGASYHDPTKPATVPNGTNEDLDAGYESETPGSVNLHKLARAEGMNTDVRRAIFITLLSASDHTEAHHKLLKLHLKAKQRLEIPRVLVHCVGAEEVYNPFYALVARKFCVAEHTLRKAWEFVLWDAFGVMEEEGMSVKKIVNLGKFYASLVAEGGLPITILKKLEFAYLSSSGTAMFAEVFLTTLLVQLHKKNKEAAAGFEKAISAVFAKTATGASDIVQGLRFFVETQVARAELVDRKGEKRAVELGCRIAVGTLDEIARDGRAGVEDEDDEDEDEDVLS